MKNRSPHEELEIKVSRHTCPYHADPGLFIHSLIFNKTATYVFYKQL